MHIRGIAGKPATIALVAAIVAAALAINLAPHIWRESKQAGASVQVLGWGANNYGQTGNGTTEYRAIDPRSNVVALDDVRQLALGLNHTIGLTSDGKVYGWGSNQFGQIAQDKRLAQRPVPSLIDNLPVVRQVAASQDHSLALSTDGTVWAWGLNIAGQLGDGSAEDRFRPAQVGGLRDVTQIAAGYRMSLALRRDGSVWAWGADCQAQSRGGDFLATVSQLAAGGAYADAGTASTTAGSYANISPEEDCINEDVVGIGSRTPLRIKGLPRIRQVAAGFGHMVALDEQGQVWAWGCNTYGQIGNGTVGRGTGANLTPSAVPGMTAVRQVAAGYRHTLILKEDGQLWAWGHNYSGELGTGKEDDENPIPAPVAGVPRIDSIAAGHDFSLALAKDGALWGWGNGEAWQINDISGLHRTPQPVWSLQHIRSVASGGGHVAAITKASKARP
jgi:alpha-tubulin suppressor-like RCC1 family protein